MILLSCPLFCYVEYSVCLDSYAFDSTIFLEICVCAVVVLPVLLVLSITSYLEIDHSDSTLIVDTFVGDIVLWNQVGCDCMLVIADRNVVIEFYQYYDIWYVILNMN